MMTLRNKKKKIDEGKLCQFFFFLSTADFSFKGELFYLRRHKRNFIFLEFCWKKNFCEGNKLMKELEAEILRYDNFSKKNIKRVFSVESSDYFTI